VTGAPPLPFPVRAGRDGVGGAGLKNVSGVSRSGAGSHWSFRDTNTGPVTITVSDAASHLQMSFTVKVIPAPVM